MDRKFVMTGLGYGILERVYLSFFEMQTVILWHNKTEGVMNSYSRLCLLSRSTSYVL